MHLSVTAEAIVVSVAGELDLATVPLLDTIVRDVRAGVVRAPSACRLHVDLRGLDFVDLRGLRALRHLTSAACAAGFAVVIRPSHAVWRVNELAGAPLTLPIHEPRLFDRHTVGAG